MIGRGRLVRAVSTLRTGEARRGFPYAGEPFVRSTARRAAPGGRCPNGHAECSPLVPAFAFAHAGRSPSRRHGTTLMLPPVLEHGGLDLIQPFQTRLLARGPERLGLRGLDLEAVDGGGEQGQLVRRPPGDRVEDDAVCRLSPHHPWALDDAGLRREAAPGERHCEPSKPAARHRQDERGGPVRRPLRPREPFPKGPILLHLNRPHGSTGACPRCPPRALGVDRRPIRIGATGRGCRRPVRATARSGPSTRGGATRRSAPSRRRPWTAASRPRAARRARRPSPCRPRLSSSP